MSALQRCDSEDAQRYLKSCQTKFWQDVFRVESDYLIRLLRDSKNILSVGCGPAIIEAVLAKEGFCVTGLDISQEVLGCAPDPVRRVVARAEGMPFPESSFDAVVFVVSLQFIEDERAAIREAARVLRPKGSLIALLLNPQSLFFRERSSRKDSYVSGIRHRSCKLIEDEVQKLFEVQSEYLIGIKEGKVFDSQDPELAALYVIQGRKVSWN